MDSQTRLAVERCLQRRSKLSPAIAGQRLPYAQTTYELVELLRLYDAVHAYDLARQTLEILPHVAEKERAAIALNTYRQLGQCAYRLGRIEAAACHLRDALHLVKSHPDIGSASVRAHLCHLQGGIDTARGHYDQALQALLQALRYSQATNDIPKHISVLLTLSLYYGRLKRPYLALEVLRQAMRLDSAGAAHPHVQMMIYNNMAWAYHDTGDTREAVRLIEIAIGLAHAYDHRIGIGITHATLGHFLNSKGAYAEAKEHFQHAYELLHQAGHQAGEVKLLLGRAVALWGLEDSDAAIADVEKALLLADSDKALRAECCELLARFHDESGNADHALIYFREFHALEKSIFNRESQARIHRMEHIHRSQWAGQAAELRHHTMEDKIQRAQLDMLERLAVAGEHDGNMRAHNHRVCRLAGMMARHLGLTEAEAAAIELAAKLHDIGKIAVPDSILTKPSSLAPNEFEVVKTHTTVGAAILARSDWPLLKLAETIALTHHEWWDGSGYPHGLQAEEIPLAGRIVAVADVYDVLISDRPYKQRWLPEDAMAAIRAKSGTHFDPAVVEAFCEVMVAQVLQS